MGTSAPIDFPRVRASLLPWPQSNEAHIGFQGRGREDRVH